MKSKPNLPAVTVIVVLTALTLIVGCGVLGNPNPCDRTQGVRDALEDATGRNCDLITDDDLADVGNLSLGLSFDDANNLKKSDFAGLNNLHTVHFRASDRLHPNSFRQLSSLSEIRHLELATAMDHDSSSCYGPDLTEATAEWFDGLTSLKTLTLCTSGELASNVHQRLTSNGVTINEILNCERTGKYGLRRYCNRPYDPRADDD